jgi:hypothetical protein
MKSTKKILLVLLTALGLLLFSACTGLLPQMSYQGVLTDQNGLPLNGTVQITYRLFNSGTGGSALYTEAEDVVVTNGLFNSVVGPESFSAGLTPEDLTNPLYLEIQIANGVYTETLTPRQRLYGSPYAFTLMPGTVISSTMPAAVYGPNGINGIVTIVNGYDGDPNTDPASPALRVAGETGIELVSPYDQNGTLVSDQSNPTSGFYIRSNDNMQLYIDDDDDEQGVFAVIGTPGGCQIADGGDLACSGTKSAVVAIEDEERLFYAVESPGVWFEDFGSDTLAGGQAVVNIESLFAQSANLGVEYHVFLTPLGDCNGLYVAEKTATGFTVRELNSGTSNIAFDYRIVARRAGYEDLRMELATFSLEAE